jgi:ferrous iron transport protein A
METLDQLLPGQSARIVKVNGCDGVAIRLREMGMIPGECVELVRLAPLGDPLKCWVHGCRIAIRRVEARRVTIERIAR